MCASSSAMSSNDVLSPFSGDKATWKSDGFDASSRRPQSCRVSASSTSLRRSSHFEDGTELSMSHGLPEAAQETRSRPQQPYSFSAFSTSSRRSSNLDDGTELSLSHDLPEAAQEARSRPQPYRFSSSSEPRQRRHSCRFSASSEPRSRPHSCRVSASSTSSRRSSHLEDGTELSMSHGLTEAAQESRSSTYGRSMHSREAPPSIRGISKKALETSGDEAVPEPRRLPRPRQEIRL
jgi:hypothetical protein